MSKILKESKASKSSQASYASIASPQISYYLKSASGLRLGANESTNEIQKSFAKSFAGEMEQPVVGRLGPKIC